MNDEQLKEIARACAKAKPQSYYAEPFEPHEWVMDALRAVADGGKHHDAIECAIQVLRQVEAGDDVSVGQCSDAIAKLEAMTLADDCKGEAQPHEAQIRERLKNAEFDEKGFVRWKKPE